MISPKQPRSQSTLLPSLTKNSSNNSPADSKIQIPDIDTVCENLLNDSKYEFEIYYSPDEVVDHLHKMCDFVMNQEEDFDYDLLQRIDDVIKEVTSKDQLLNTNSSHKNTIDQLNSKLDSTKKEITQIEGRFSNVKQNFEERKKKDIERLKKKQREEIQEFQVKYSMDNIPPRYRKLSSDVINIRNRERKLRIMHKFIEAKQMREEGDRLEKEEMELNYQKWQNEREIAKNTLIKKHRQQVICLNEKWNRHWQVLVQGMENEQDNKKLVIQKTQRKVSEAKSKKDFPPPRTPRSASVSRLSTSRTRSVKSDRL
ncbi:hypothetical protein M9Y10_021942 [Tritrichomonas musculus]|uniref:IQ calmodulin-binding motif family protein n=1 Tax=Tritrichomonas musculus TaxID=1915356 RepID=A0ABR2KQV0_9EUKA